MDAVFILARINHDITLKIFIIEWLSIFRRLPGVRIEVHLGDGFCFNFLTEASNPLHLRLPVRLPVTLVLPQCYFSIHISSGTIWFMKVILGSAKRESLKDEGGAGTDWFQRQGF